MDFAIKQLYQEQVMDHYRNPRNVAVLGSCDVTHAGANPTCGDRLVMELQFVNGRVSAVSARAVGCAISVASASLLSEYMKGKTREALVAVDESVIRQLLGVEISPNRLRCAMLPLAVLRKITGN
jgi:nitrogen fixation NifU-like protein